MNEIMLRAYAKINLTLDVGQRRSDGFHAIRSVMQTISLHDMLTLRLDPERHSIALHVTGDEAGSVPGGVSNLVWQAAARVREIAADAAGGVSIHLHKNIPSQAGLGGGSADAAATLRGMNFLLRLAHPPERLAAIGAELGSDVPFFLTGGMVLAEGRGERLTDLPPLPEPWHLVVIKPSNGVPTAFAYRELAQMPGRTMGQFTERWLAGRRETGNDFEQVVLAAVPEAQAIFAWLTGQEEVWPGARPVLCGSGSAVFCRAASHEAAARLARRAQDEGLGNAWAVKTIGEQA